MSMARPKPFYQIHRPRITYYFILLADSNDRKRAIKPDTTGLAADVD